MGAGRRTGFVRSSDEEDEGSGAGTGVEGAGPSSSRAAQKRRKRSVSQASLGPQSTAGKPKEYKRLKHTAKSKIKYLDSDSDEEDYESEDITGAALRHKISGKKEDRGFMKKKGKSSSKSSLCKKRKQSFFSGQKTHSPKAGGFHFEETAEETSQWQTGDAIEAPIGKEFEQYLLQEVFNISKDTYTKEVDLPERFQIHEELVSAYIAKGDWSKEAYWIYDRASENSAMISDEEELKVIAEIDKEEIVQEIIFVLMQLHVHKCEIPFIGMYNFHGCMHLAGRKGSSNTSFNFEENNTQLRSFKALWCIFYLDRKWLLLQHHIDMQLETWKNRAVLKESDCVTKDGTLDMLIQALQDAESEPVVDDLVAKFNLLCPTDEEAQPKGQYKRPKRQSYYDICRKSGLRQLVKHLGLTPEQLGENLQASEKIHEAVDCEAPPEDADLSCASGHFTEIHHALAGARHMAAYEMSCEPRVRNYVRNLFMEHAVLNTRPSTKGNNLLDAFHEFSCVKYVQEKPVKTFDDGEWLIIQRAEEEQLVEVTIELTQEIFDGVVMRGLNELYLSNGSNEVAALWNEQRKLTLQEAISKIILPALLKEMRMHLTAKAKAWVQSECGKNLWKRASIAPHIPADASPDDYLSSKNTSDTTNARVLACCWGSRNPPTTFVMLDIFGELVDTLQTGYLNVHPGSLDQQLQRKTDDQERLQNFIVKHQPHVVVVGATVHYTCRQLKDTITETVARAAEQSTSLSSVPVIFGDESLPSLCEKSQLSNTQLPKQPNIIRRAVALGRSIQNPLALIASLCNPSKDIVALNLHPMQRFLSTEELYSAIEQVMITVTNQVGVDVNLAVAHEWLFSPLQFICGLGWKKASILQQLIQAIRWLPSRGHLLRHPFSLKDVVFRNCSGFLRIRRVAHAVSGLRKLDPLDDTRIHPDSYELAQNLAKYALSTGQELSGSDADLEMAETAIDYIQQNPDILTEATVMDFFSSLEAFEGVNIETLKNIRSELLCGFKDYRTPYTQPTQDEEFSWLTGEDDYSLATGKPVNVTVHKVFRHRIMCILESGIRGVLEKENFTSDSSVDLTKIFSEGSTLTCCIASVMKDQFLVSLTCKEAESCTSDASSVQKMLLTEKVSEKLGPKDYLFKPRDVCHSHFKNVSVSNAIKALSDKNPGEVIFHPSSRGPACLSMTLKCHDNVFLQKEIEELNKDSTNLATFSQLGRNLKIGGSSFQTLDEVVTSYASPLMGKMNDVLQLKEFQFGSDSDIKSFLHQEKGASSESLVYCFSMCPNNPGAIALSFVVDESIKQETVDLHPEGYEFESKMFRRIETLVNYLKKAVLAASYEPQMWRSRGEDTDGTGRGRGRGGRFGSGGRGRGRDGRGGRGNGSRGRWGDANKDGMDGFGDAQGDAQEGNPFSGGWGDKDDWSQSQNNNGDNNRGRGERGSFRGRRGRGRGYGRGGEGGRWGQANNKTEENFWSGGTKRKEDIDPLKVSDTGVGISSWDDGNVGNDGWGSTGDQVEEHNKTNENDLSTWGADCNTKSFSEEKGNERAQSGNAKECLQDNKSFGLEGWGTASEPVSTVSKDTENAKEVHNGWETVHVQASKSAENDGWGTGGDGWESTGCHMNEHGEKSEKYPSSWTAKHNSKSSSEEKGNGWVQDGNAVKHPQGNESSGVEGWGRLSDVRTAKDSFNGWDLVDKAASAGAGWGTGNDSQGAVDWQVDKLKKNEKDLNGWDAGHNNSEERGNQWTRDGNKKGGGLSGKGPTVGGWGDDDSQQKHRDCDMGWGAQKGESYEGGLLGKDLTDGRGGESFVGGWGGDDSPEKHSNDDMRWGAQKENTNNGGLLGKAPTDGGGGASSEGGWGGNDSQEKHLKDDMEWGAQKGQSNNVGLLGKAPTDGGWGGDDSHEKNIKDDMGWGAQKGQSHNGGLLGKAQTERGWGESSDGGWGGSSVGGWGGNDSQEKHSKDDMGWGAQNNGGLLGKAPTDGGWGGSSVGGWGGDDSQEKDLKDDTGWGALKGQNNGGGLIGKARIGGGWGESAADGWEDVDSQEKNRSSGLGWGVLKEQHRGGWGGSDGSEERWPKDDSQRHAQSSAEDDYGRGSFRGGRGWGRGMGRGGRGRGFQGEGGMGGGGRGRWSQREDGMGRGNRGRWSQGEDGIGSGNRGRWSQNEGGTRGARGGWQQSRGDASGRRGRGGRGRWNDGDSMGRGGRGSWAQKQGEGASDNSWGSDGWSRDSKAGKATATDANNWWASSSHRDTTQKERGRGNCWSSKDTIKDKEGSGWDAWAPSSRKVETGGWGEEASPGHQDTTAQKERGCGNWGNSSKDTSEDKAGTGWGGWAPSSSEVETGGWGEASSGHQDTAQKERGLGNWGSSSKDASKDKAGTGWGEWAPCSSEVETGGWGDTLNSGKTTKEIPAQNCKDDVIADWRGTLNNSVKTAKEAPAQKHKNGAESGWGSWTHSGECVNTSSAKGNVTSEKSSGWAADEGGWTSSKETGLATGCMDVDRGWDANEERHVSNSSGLPSDDKTTNDQKEWRDSVQIHTERTEWAEPPTQETAPTESKLGCKEFNSKEGTEERGDGIWGACEDLIDSKEMEGLISGKGHFENALKPSNMNDASQGQAAVSEGLRDADHDRLDNLAVSVLKGHPSDENNPSTFGDTGL